MVRRLPLLLTALACRDPDPDPAGDWDLTLVCESAPATTAPACGDGAGGILRLEPTGEGEHRTFFPGFPRPDGAYTGMPGPAAWSLDGGLLVVDLAGDLDDPLVSEEERAGWATHTLALTGRFESVCWSAGFEWVQDDGTVDVRGEVTATRHGMACR